MFKMKKLTLLLLSFVLAFTLEAQDGKKLLKDAKKELATYNQNVAANSANLETALKALNEAFQDPAVESDPEAWLTKGELYNEIIDANFKQSLIDPNHKNGYPDAAMMATKAFEQALAKAVKKGQTKSALKGLNVSETNLYNIGANMYDAQNYKGSYNNFKEAIRVSELLKSNQNESRLDDEKLKDELYFYTLVAGSLAEEKDGLIPFAEYLYNKGTDKSYVYQVLHEIYTAKEDDANAEKYLKEGRVKFPEETGLLFAEINFALKKGKLDELILKLKEASALEPDNLTIINTLGSVNEQLAKKNLEAGDTAKAEEYNKEALKYYELVIEKDPTNFDAQYNIGAYYYNQAAKMAGKVNDLAQDYTAQGTKKYNAAKAEMTALFEKALPYFLKADELNKEDNNTILALREIHVRLGKVEAANVYKERLDALKN